MKVTLKKLHNWIGLFSFTVLIVFGIVGIRGAFRSAGAQPFTPHDSRVESYEAPGDYTDSQVAADLYDRYAIPLVRPVPNWALGRNAEGILVLDFYGASGRQRITVLEDASEVRIEVSRTSFGGFLSAMHALSAVGAVPDARLLLWIAYLHLSILSLVFMSVTGVWLWARSRPRLWWARASFGAGTALFLVLWFATR